MSASPFPPPAAPSSRRFDLADSSLSMSRLDRSSDAPLALDLSGGYPVHTGSIEAPIQPIPTGLRSFIPASWLGMSGYLAAGVLLGVVLIVVLSLARSEPTSKASAGLVTDNVVRLAGRDVGEACWRGATRSDARVSVAMEIGLDGKVRSAVATSDSPAMKSCIEAHVKGWEFLPQATASTMVLPFEIKR